MSQQAITALGLFLISYAFIISEKIHRTIVAMIGAIFVVGLGILDQETAFQHIDLNTIGLLIGMMIIVAITAKTGVFKYVAVWAAKKAGGYPVRILVVLGAVTAFCSAFLDNVTTVLLIVPVTLSITRRLQVDPIPFFHLANYGQQHRRYGYLDRRSPEYYDRQRCEGTDLQCIYCPFDADRHRHHGSHSAIFALLYRKSIQTTEELRLSIMELDEKAEIQDPVLLKKNA